MMSDYHHYKYQCPFITGTAENKVFCEGGCRIQFSAIADCREFLRLYCAHEDQHWKHCNIAQAKMRRIEKNEEIKKGIKRWKETKNSTSQKKN